MVVSELCVVFESLVRLEYAIPTSTASSSREEPPKRVGQGRKRFLFRGEHGSWWRAAVVFTHDGRSRRTLQLPIPEQQHDGLGRLGRCEWWRAAYQRDEDQPIFRAQDTEDEATCVEP